MDNQKNIHDSSAQSQQSQQSQEASTQTEYANYPWVPQQWMQHLSQSGSHNAANASESPQTPQPFSQPTTTPIIPTPVFQPHSPLISGLPSSNILGLASSTAPTTPGPEHPLSPWRRIPRPVAKKTNWLEYVSNLPWLLNSEIPKQDRRCPFCWGDFGMALVYEDVDGDEAMASSASEDEVEEEEAHEEEDEEADVSEFFELNLAANGESASAIPAGQGLHVTNPDPMCEPEEEDAETQDVQSADLTESQKSTVRQLRGETHMVEDDEEKKKVGKKHYAVKLPCGHLYGHMCLVKMLESGETTCPKCRKDVIEGRVRTP